MMMLLRRECQLFIVIRSKSAHAKGLYQEVSENGENRICRLLTPSRQ